MEKTAVEESAAMGKFNMGQIIGDKWKIVQKLDEGGFGSVYKVQHVQDPNKFAALKVERANSDEINYLKLETAVLKELHGTGIRAHVPQLYRSAKRKHYCYIIITLLGENLKRLKDKFFAKSGMPLRTWSRVGVQCLYGIKTMHDRGYVHRDIKAQNFVLGYHATAAYARVVYIIDFGLARAYAFPPSARGSNKWLARKARARLEFRGTWRYASPAMHEEKEQGRKDDLWSWLYMMMDLYCGLPWMETDGKETIELKKLHMKDEDLMIRMPDECKFIPKHLRGLDMYQRPDYLRIYVAFDNIRKKYKTAYEDPYEWETKESAMLNRSAMVNKTAPLGYTAADGFFKSDPIGIYKAPTAAEEKELNARFVFAPITPATPNTPAAAAAAAATGAAAAAKADVLVAANQTRVAVSPLPSRSPATTPTQSPGTDLKKKSPPRGDKKKTGSKDTKKKKKNKKDKFGEGTEDSVDFVPSCYITNAAAPVNYVPAVAGTPVMKPSREVIGKERQQESSGGPPSDNSLSRGGGGHSHGGSAPSSARSDHSTNSNTSKKVNFNNSIMQNTVTDDPTILRESLMKIAPKDVSNRSFSLVRPGYVYNDKKKKNANK